MVNKSVFISALVMLLAMIFATAYSAASGEPGKYPAGSVVAKYGKLQVIGTKLCDEKGKQVQLRGVSTHHLNVSSAFVTPEAVAYLAKDWKIDILRAAMHYDNEIFTQNPRTLIDKVREIVGMCETNGIYVIIDWHTLEDKNPLKHKELAKKFFEEMVDSFGNKNHVIFEICNEPNGEDTGWDNAIKPYANEIIPIIRAKSDNIILVGTPKWSSQVEVALKDPLNFKNIMYVFHFYAGSNQQESRDYISQYADKIPLFCSEWGTTGNTGLAGYTPEESKKWLDLLDKYKISSCNWAFFAAQDECAIINIWKLKAGSLQTGTITEKMLTPSGKFVRNYTKNRW